MTSASSSAAALLMRLSPATSTLELDFYNKHLPHDDHAPLPTTFQPRHLRHLSTTSFYAKLSKVPLCEDLDNQVLRKGEACYSSCGKTKSRQKCDPRVAEYGLSFSKNEDCRSRIECVAEDRVLCMLDKGGVDEAGMGGGGGVLGKAVLTAAAGGGAGAGRDLDPGRKRSTSKKVKSRSAIRSTPRRQKSKSNEGQKVLANPNIREDSTSPVPLRGSGLREFL
mmetsp:Transcript_1949/g.4493  ORF Transcript_1949/g.4493 Transcript_1949/m.4493 type:complete len:223 (-) Transcript_1949:193-861(-)